MRRTRGKGSRNTPEPLFVLAGAGHETYGDSSYYYDSRVRPDQPHATLQLTLAGTGFYQSSRGRELLTPGRAFFAIIPGPFEYGYEPGSSRSLEIVFVSLRDSAALEWYERITKRFGNVMNLGLDRSVAEQMLWIAHASEANRLPDRYEMSAILYRLLMTLYSSLTWTRSTTSPRVARAIELITAHANDPRFNIERLAERIGCTREYLARQFRAAAGVTPSEYLLEHRVRLVARSLRSGEEKLELVARRCGFSGANYLCRAFRQRTGVTPARFREDRWRAVP
jgi:AraC-like DNA-binding protein